MIFPLQKDPKISDSVLQNSIIQWIFPFHYNNPKNLDPYYGSRFLGLFWKGNSLSYNQYIKLILHKYN